jgi:hypothetical protein
MGLQQQGKTRVGFFLARNRMPFSLFPLNEWRPAPPEIGTSGQLHMVTLRGFAWKDRLKSRRAATWETAKHAAR